MTPQEIIQLVEALRANGVSSFKNGGMEVSFSVKIDTLTAELKSEQVPLDAPIELSPEIKHQVEEVTSLLRLSDTELVDKLFPDHTQQDEEVIQ